LGFLWKGGVARTAVEEARNAKAKLFVYRGSFYEKKGIKSTGPNALAM